MRSLVPVVIAIAVLALVQVLSSDSPYFTYLALVVGVNVVLAVSLNVINGMTGQFSIGHAGFMAVGAFSSAVTSMALNEYRIGFLPSGVEHQLFFVLSLLVGGIFAAACGFVVGLPSLRLRGDYLAIVTLGFGEIILVIVRNTPRLGGALGLSGMPQHTTLFAVWFTVFLVILFSRRLLTSPHGRNLVAIREDEVAAEAMGVDTTAYKVRAFVVSSFFAGVAGGLFAHFQSIIAPGDSFSFVRSMEVVVFIVAGGLGSTSGAVVAAVVLTLLPEAMRAGFIKMNELANAEWLPAALREWLSGFAGESAAQSIDQLRKPIFGLLLVLMMLTRPQGLFGTHEVWDWLKPKKKIEPQRGAAS